MRCDSGIKYEVMIIIEIDDFLWKSMMIQFIHYWYGVLRLPIDKSGEMQ